MSSPNSTKQLWRGFYLVLAVLLVLDPELLELLHVLDHDPEHEAHFGIDGMPGFYALFGLVVCVVTVAISKVMLGKIVLRPAAYYDKSPLDPTRDDKGRPISAAKEAR
ncbi:hypothetical protein ACNOYE_22895 [Nannocystaceae bacterium ST9]